MRGLLITGRLGDQQRGDSRCSGLGEGTALAERAVDHHPGHLRATPGEIVADDHDVYRRWDLTQHPAQSHRLSRRVLHRRRPI
ncbi:MAG: hypothetical protein M3376_03510 [Actinomycetota bacterium]|nr:hypothetical protein [Actinomycetota bacterium]